MDHQLAQRPSLDELKRGERLTLPAEHTRIQRNRAKKLSWLTILLLIGLIADVDVAVRIYGILTVVVSCTPTSFIVEDHEVDFQVNLVNVFECQAPFNERLDPWVMVLEIDLHGVVWQ
jgi:hypothetical protein